MTESQTKNICNFHWRCDARKHNVVCQKTKSCFEETKETYTKEEVEQLLKDFSKQFNMACDWRDGITNKFIEERL